ncbi:MAG: EAL domain-containing protein, partial [Tolumonas sp.]|nr:EAL domain-containing protein [Tolumonas sp.]
MISNVFLKTAYKSLIQEVVEGIPIRVFWKDRECRYLGCNSLFAQDAGFSHSSDLIGKTDFDMIWHDQAAIYRADDMQVMESGQPKLNYEEPLTSTNGKLVYLRTSKVPLRNANQEIIGILGIYEDITERKKAEQMEKHLTRALKLLSKCNTTLIHADNEQTLLVDICRLAVEIGGYRMAWVGYQENDEAKTIRPVARSGYEHGFLDDIKISWADNEWGQGPTGTAIRTGATVVNSNTQTNSKLMPWRQAATERNYRSSISLPLATKNKMLGALNIYSSEADAFSAEEISLLEELANDLAFGIETLRTRALHNVAEKKLEFLAHYDPLTSLPNRTLLRDRFEQAAAIADREQSGVAIFFLDLDNFTHINDSLGHIYGDKLLVSVANRLKQCIRKTDTLSRQGGDEFAILLSNINDVESIEEIIHGIVSSFTEPFDIDGYTLNITFSAGISVYPHDDKSFDALLKHADTALYHAKHSGRNIYRFFSGQMNNDALEYIQLQGQLHNAIKNKELQLYYQPQIDTTTGKIIGAEALLRWNHPEHGLIPPAKFIPSAERSGLIIPIGEWVLNEACRQIQLWRETDQIPSFVVAVNLSALQFKRGDLAETVALALEHANLPASHLELELTESILLHDVNDVRNTLHSLKKIGVRLSIDDFGTGYSSLSYLKQLAVDKLKIDQSFIHDMVEDAGDAAIVKAIIQLGHALELSVIAEGVEKNTQFAALKELGCDEIQGYLFSRPLPAEEFIRFYRDMKLG